MAICTKCGKVLLRIERGNIKSSLGVDGFEHKNCNVAIGWFSDSPIVNSPIPKPFIMEPKKKEKKSEVFSFKLRKPEEIEEQKDDESAKEFK